MVDRYCSLLLTAITPETLLSSTTVWPLLQQLSWPHSSISCNSQAPAASPGCGSKQHDKQPGAGRGRCEQHKAARLEHKWQDWRCVQNAGLGCGAFTSIASSVGTLRQQYKLHLAQHVTNLFGCCFCPANTATVPSVPPRSAVYLLDYANGMQVPTHLPFPLDTSMACSFTQAIMLRSQTCPSERAQHSAYSQHACTPEAALHHVSWSH